jgi:cardiolipin synthase
MAAPDHPDPHDPTRWDDWQWSRAAGLAVGFVGGNEVRLLQGGDELFPAMCAAIDAAREEVWLATYIWTDDPGASCVTRALAEAAARGVVVRCVADGFGTHDSLGAVRALWATPPAPEVEVFRPLDRWWSWLQPSQLRRLHQKLCVVDRQVAFVGGINLIDDRHDLHHGWVEAPRLDFAVELRGPLALSVHASVRAVWLRARLGQRWRQQMRRLARAREPVEATRRLLRGLSAAPRAEGGAPPEDHGGPVQAAFLVRDNVRLRRTIERTYVAAIRGAKQRVDIAVPYFYPGRTFRRALRVAARRGVRVRLLLQGKIDYRIAALAARALYDELRGTGVRIHEYTPAFLHAKVAVVDDDWATVGSSNIDPLSLLLNLEANVVVRDADFARTLGARLDEAFAASHEVTNESASFTPGWRGRFQRWAVAVIAGAYLRVAGITGRY